MVVVTEQTTKALDLKTYWFQVKVEFIETSLTTYPWYGGVYFLDQVSMYYIHA